MEKDDEVSIASFVAETHLKTKQIVYTWTIKNLSYYYSKDGEGIAGPSFHARIFDKKCSWYPVLYPNGKENSGDWVAVHITSGIGSDELEAYVKLSTIDQFQRETVQFAGFHQFKPSTLNKQFLWEALEVNRFVKKTTLASVMVNGNLTIRCKIYFDPDEHNSYISSTSSAFAADKTATLHRLVTEFEDFGKLLTNPKFSDVKLVVGATEFPAHKNVLAARSPVFSAMFEHDMKENRENVVAITDVDDKIMKEVLLFIYTGKVTDIESMAKELLPVADKYELNGLKSMCEETLIATMSNDTISEILILVDKHNADELCTAAIEFVTVHASDLATTESFLTVMNNLSPPLLAKVIKAFMLKA